MKAFLAIVLVAVATVSQAASFSGDDPTCRAMGRIAYEAGTMRDAGVKWDEYSQMLDANLKEAVGNPDSFVKTESDAAWVRAALQVVFESKDEAIRLALRTYEKCMQKVV